MPIATQAVVRNGRLELLEPLALPEGSRVLVTLLSDDDTAFWEAASAETLARIWDNPEDDAYAALLEE
jgi:predicted DNA-binding antitoxin AbrB/MazE fold protein